ncbi:hypothetical protein KIH74_22740 [Kineosporia sp. J2-2]|uniref:Uncharacterized protein n=1 Tax=Kineosporia corallincola TaxID=2835133 RepID=A0ABS5TNJ8_9ACTN|nr:hypothetical protein [Kineosporia corallincola]MBT0771776.1 hypothetical protein [Kineosporia corallincola]
MDTPIPATPDEAAKRARGELWLSTSGSLHQDWHPPRGHTYVRIDEVRGDWVGRRVIRQAEDRTHDRGWYVVAPPQIGAMLPDAPNPASVYVPVVGERAWWEHVIGGAAVRPERWVRVERVWLDESEDPAPR